MRGRAVGCLGSLRRTAGKDPQSGIAPASALKCGMSRLWPRCHARAAILLLVHLMEHGQTEQVQFAAVKELLDRGHGRSRQEISVEDRKTVVIVDRGRSLRDLPPTADDAG